MKKSALVFAFLFCSICVFAQMTLERSYFGLTLGKTNKTEVIKQIKCSDDIIPMYLCGGEESMTYRGKFTVDGFDFSIVIASFYNDILYKLEFVETCQNCDISAKIRSFLMLEQDKYMLLYDQVESMLDTSFYREYNLLAPILKTDGTTSITITGNNNFVSLEVKDKDMDERAFYESMEILNRSLKGDYSSEYVVTGVGGLAFGETKETAMQKFGDRGTLVESSNRQVTYSNVSVGGVIYDLAILYFSSGNQDSQRKLISVSLQKLHSPYQFDVALQMYQSICRTYQNKYKNGKELVNNGNSRMSGYGMLSSDYAEGRLYPIGITLQKSLSKGGSQFYYVTVSYFIDNISSIHNDDI